MKTNIEGYAIKVGGLIAADEALHNKLAKPPLGDLFKKALATKAKSMPQMIAEQWRVARGPGRLSTRDYFRYRLYRPELTEADRMAFISDDVNWPVINQVSDRTWRAATEDKWLSYQILGAAGVPTPPTKAVFDTTARSFVKTRKLASADDLGRFLANEARFPLFAKPNSQLASFGAFAVRSFADGQALIHTGERLTPADMVAKLFGEVSFLLQDCIANHPAIAALADGLATIRLMNFVGPGGVATPFAVLKIPAGGNIADNFWRPGNLLANIDVTTGTLTRVIRGHGPDEEELESGVGLAIPFWSEVLDLNRRAAEFYAPVAYNSLDVCVTPAGPLVVEINSGGSFDLTQSASGKGMLTPDVLAFFAGRGWKPAIKALRSRSR
jgi:hypothetical protein